MPAKRNVVNVYLKAPSTLWLFSPHHESLDPIPFIHPPPPLSVLQEPEVPLNRAIDQPVAYLQCPIHNIPKSFGPIWTCISHSSTMDFWFAFIQDTMSNDRDYVDVGLCCADVRQVLDRGLNGRRLDELSPSVLSAIRNLSM